MSIVWVLFFIGAGNIQPMHVGSAYVSYSTCTYSINQIALSTGTHTGYVESKAGTGELILKEEFSDAARAGVPGAGQFIEKVKATREQYACIAIDYELYEKSYAK